MCINGTRRHTASGNPAIAYMQKFPFLAGEMAGEESITPRFLILKRLGEASVVWAPWLAKLSISV